MEALLLWFALFSLVSWLAAEYVEPIPASAPTPEARPPRRIRRALARSPAPSPPLSPVFLSPSAAPFATSHAVMMARYPKNMERSSFLNEEEEKHFGRMQRVFDPVLGWRWRAYPAGTHEARMQELRENKEGKRPVVEVEPDAQSPNVLPPLPWSSPPIVFTSTRSPPPAPHPSLPASTPTTASRLFLGISALPEPGGVHLLAAVPSWAPGFAEQFAPSCTATRFALLPWPTPSFAEQFAWSCRASQHLPLPWPLLPPAPVAPVMVVVPMTAPSMHPPPSSMAPSELPSAPPSVPDLVSSLAPSSLASSAPGSSGLGAPLPPTSAPPRRVLAARRPRAAPQQTTPALTPAASAPALGPDPGPASVSAAASAPQQTASAPPPPAPSRPAAAPRRAAPPRKSTFSALMEEAKKGQRSLMFCG
jgi:hypothetical protein